jgi:hypothetical protein
MLGKPKHKEGTTVKFIVCGKSKKGVIWIVDKYGTWNYTEDVSYDIMVESENMFYKHIPEKYIVQRYYKKNKKNDVKSI